MSEFKIGDTVQLNSGGPLMTVRVVNTSAIGCTYFDQEGKLHGMETGYHFKQEMLKKVSLTDKPTAKRVSPSSSVI